MKLKLEHKCWKQYLSNICCNMHQLRLHSKVLVNKSRLSPLLSPCHATGPDPGTQAGSGTARIPLFIKPIK